jgi:hypothetical protein
MVSTFGTTPMTSARRSTFRFARSSVTVAAIRAQRSRGPVLAGASARCEISCMRDGVARGVHQGAEFGLLLAQDVGLPTTRA